MNLLQMKPEEQSIELLKITQSKAKMYEYGVALEDHISIGEKEPIKLLFLTIGILGDYGKNPLGIQTDEYLKENHNKILFAAQFFDTYVESRLSPILADYFLLVGSASYYLADYPGSASVLIKKLNSNSSFETQGLETLLIWLLQNDLSIAINFEASIYHDQLKTIYSSLIEFYEKGENEELIIMQVDSLCEITYSSGTDRELLFSDIIRSIIKKQIDNSTWNSLKKYSQLSIQLWRDTILKTNFIREFWPAQKLIGEKDVFNGSSAIIQMPTSAGKTKSIEIIIRSSFLSDRSRMAVVVAPFRALCFEIKNNLQLAFKDEFVSIDEPTDVMQPDFDLITNFDFAYSNLVLILTPEKLMYILRSTPELASEIGLLIYDEGHQFDNGIRGITYELLLSSLKNLVSENTQVVLISAVISNAESIGNWLISNNKVVVEGLNLFPTYRTIAFTSWKTQLGRLEFVKYDSPDDKDYFVPRVLEQHQLNQKPRERKHKFFPEKSDGKSIALYLGLKLIANGPLAIFCGGKKTVKSIYEMAVDLKLRNYDISSVLLNSDQTEVTKIANLHSLHFGEESILTKSTRLGIFSHSGNTPQGLRQVIEFSMQKGKIKFIICTSTLAQGVNLPIKYLFVTSFYQAGEEIKTRDFHNLIGRAGRSGKHTEGTIIFTDTELFDNKNKIQQDWKWNQTKRLLNPINAEPCGSTLLSIFDPLISDNKIYSKTIDPLEYIKDYLKTGNISNFIEQVALQSNRQFSVATVTYQMDNKLDIVSAIESFLMAHWDKFTNGQPITEIAKETLAYALADDVQKQQIIELFNLLISNIETKIDTPAKRLAYSKTMFGIQDMLDIEAWVSENITNLISSSSLDELLENIWLILFEKTRNSNLKKLDPPTLCLQLAKKWTEGTSYVNILKFLTENNCKILAGSQKREIQQEQIISICEGAFSYTTTLVIAALVEIINVRVDTNQELASSLNDRLNELQKRIKYGLPSSLAICFYEIGFVDRIIAMDLASKFPLFPINKSGLKNEIREHSDEVVNILKTYPDFFTDVLNKIIAE